ncbi:putative ABC transport system ATP-binding protein [Halogranum rubrum]|uniref:Putative ABC transport system ATP-binding protein n=1 Tax=Halogranum rubrum TaxID=553466 RepID=A0A1I4HYI4_9EURY|nr:ABC transporter ATP-binding protein [Halogranum rubrum]SFL46853.1 putative ABC transport system ATP-binding protein [Halogranum rubrum]
MTAIEVTNVTKEYQTGEETFLALKGIDFSLARGEFVSIMGPSGSGKSTFLNIIGLLDQPTTGSVSLDGQDVTELTDRRRTTVRKQTIGFIFQDFFLIPTLSAKENVELPAIYEIDETIRSRATMLLERVGLGNRLKHHPDQLSGGQKQRVAIARSLINSPRILLADEPTGNLDSETSEQVLDEFTRIARDENVAIIAVTHDPQVTEYTDRTIELRDGRLTS